MALTQAYNLVPGMTSSVLLRQWTIRATFTTSFTHAQLIGNGQIMQISHAIAYSGTAVTANTMLRGQTEAFPTKHHSTARRQIRQ